MGIELDVLVGHPEHDLLFVATQVARAAGLKDPGSSIRTSKRRLPDGSIQLSSLTALSAASLPKEPNGASIRTTTVLMADSGHPWHLPTSEAEGGSSSTHAAHTSTLMPEHNVLLPVARSYVKSP